MGLIFAFIAGFWAGGRGGQEGVNEVMEAAKAVRDSREFESLLNAVRSHTGHVLQEVGKRLQPEAEEPISLASIIEGARTFVSQSRESAS